MQKPIINHCLSPQKPIMGQLLPKITALALQATLCCEATSGPDVAWLVVDGGWLKLLFFRVINAGFMVVNGS